MKGRIFKAFMATTAVFVLFASVVPSYASAHTKMVSHSSTYVNSEQNLQVVQPQGVKTKIISAALRYGGTALENLIKKIPYKWADKVGDSVGKYGHIAADVVDELNEFTETAVALALVKAGIPPADALIIAKFIVFFVG